VDADEDGIGGDDAADCFWYLVPTKTRVISQRRLRGLWALLFGSLWKVVRIERGLVNPAVLQIDDCLEPPRPIMCLEPAKWRIDGVAEACAPSEFCVCVSCLYPASKKTNAANICCYC
jgi:hypothetical protein